MNERDKKAGSALRCRNVGPAQSYWSDKQSYFTVELTLFLS